MKPTETIRIDEDSGRAEQSGMIETQIERILAAEDELIPTSGFLASVMERVQEATAAPPSIPFPWKRALPGALLVAGVSGWGAVEWMQSDVFKLDLTAQNWFMQALLHPSSALVSSAEPAGWVALALGASLFSWLLSRRLAGRGGLL